MTSSYGHSDNLQWQSWHHGYFSGLTHLPLEPHIFSESVQHLVQILSPIRTLRNKLQWNFNQNTILFIHEKVCENVVCETEAIWCWVNWHREWIMRKAPWWMKFYNHAGHRSTVNTHLLRSFAQHIFKTTRVPNFAKSAEVLIHNQFFTKIY